MMLHRRVPTLFHKWSKNYKSFYLRPASTDMQPWKPTIGLEIHAQIATNSKLFSKASTNFLSAVNSSVSLFDCAIPGTMPVLNKKCVEAGVLTALALSCELNEVSMFERKHYFYPDLPAGFQITQQKKPLAINGEITFYVYTPGVHKEPYIKTSKIKQIQLEQDSGKSLHFEDWGKSLIDLNRAGVPLMELVFEPDLNDGEEAAALVKELILILEMLGTCSCKMEEGALRIDANVSVARAGEPVGTRTEIKNVGSTRAVAAAIRYEIQRQISILSSGGTIFNETRAWNAVKNQTIPMREKEEKQDYRFMPETNLPPLFLYINEDVKNKHNLVDVPALRATLPTLPDEIREVLRVKHNLKVMTIITLMSDKALLQLYLSLVGENTNRECQSLANFLLNEVLTFLNKNKLDIAFCMDKQDFIGETFDLRNKKQVSIPIAKKILKMLSTDTHKTPRQIVEENGWFIITDESKLERICLEVIDKNSSMVQKYKRKRKPSVFQAILKQVSLTTNDTASQASVARILEKLLS